MYRSALIGSYFSTASLPPLAPVDHAALLQQAVACLETSEAAAAPPAPGPLISPVPQLRPVLQSVISGKTLSPRAGDRPAAAAAAGAADQPLMRRSLVRTTSAPQGALSAMAAAPDSSAPPTGAFHVLFWILLACVCLDVILVRC